MMIMFMIVMALTAVTVMAVNITMKILKAGQSVKHVADTGNMMTNP